MRGRRRDLPASRAGMEERLTQALTRLTEGKPNCPELQKKAKAKKLRVNVISVALEAGGPDEHGVWKGLSRSLIGHDGCPYPKVRAAILQSKHEPHAGDLKSINDSLRKKNRELEHEAKLALSLSAAMLNRMKALEKAVKAKVESVQRTEKRGPRPVNQAPFLVVDNVSPLQDNEE